METQDFFSPADLDAIEQTPNFMESVFSDVSTRVQPAKILDVGCGNGFFSIFFKQKTPVFLSGVDSSSYGLDRARAKGFDEVKITGDLSKDQLPHMDNSFDLVLCKDVLEHLYNPLHAVKEAHRVLKTGGYYFVLVPNHFTVWSRIKFLFTGNIDTQLFFPNANSWSFPHIRFFKSKEFVSEIEKLGFKVAHNYCGDFASFPLLRRLPGGSSLKKRLAQNDPDNYADALAYLFQKI